MAADRRSLSPLEMERRASRVLPRSIWSAVEGGKGAGWTLRENVEAFTRVGFATSTFDRAANPDQSTAFLGQSLHTPVAVAPVGAVALHPDGEVGLARAAASVGAGMFLSSWASASVRDVAAANPATFFQLYWVGDRTAIEHRIELARNAGAKGLVVTLDFTHAKLRDGRTGIAVPARIDLPTMLSMAPAAIAHPRWISRYLLRGRLPALAVPNLARADGTVPSFGEAWTEYAATPPPSWDDLEWIRERWGGPIMIKGILTSSDARRAVDLGAGGVGVSNHGGNNIDYTPATLRVLPAISEAIAGAAQISMDGGVRRGSDIAKALCLGADLVLVGRAVIHGLIADGERGARSVLTSLVAGLTETMSALGTRMVADLSRDCVTVLDRDFLLDANQATR